MTERFNDMGFDNVRDIPVSDITFDETLIQLCEQNSCGNYKRNYCCPPYVGKTEELVMKAKSYKRAMVFQKIYPLEDSFDIEGMNESIKDFRKLIDIVKERAEKEELVLGAGGCRLCKVCGAIDDIPCRFPERAVASLESYSINVSELAKACGLNYINGQNTVTYFGAVLY